ncbi:hypothetical protein N7460_012285 [Penicillium canescens]|uniref:Uncharacterized protein n=1 Tax=Penicillium canescens TaxID=5083 RepID=A0AAD6I351_PENCN|nr:hypothetical protein N7460_012285 [Penicillium canescens]KAJ6040742.1 hypothetical protein N7444_009647 [Penicillium canescens]
METNQKVQDYVQGVFTDEGQMVICLTIEQASLLVNGEPFEVDMAAKRLCRADLREVVFARKIKDRQRKAIVMDMDTKQYGGLGDYLHEIDPLHRDPRVLSANQIVFCQIHFDRGINDCLKKEMSIPTGAASIMRSILEVSTSEGYYEALDWIIERFSSYSFIREWAKHKKQNWIAQGLCQSCSPIPIAIFRYLRKNTNAVEQTHHKGNARGRRLTLLQALINGRQIDELDIQQYNAWKLSGIRPTYRAGGISAEYDRFIDRSLQNQQRRSESTITYDSDEEQALRFSGRSSTSGVPIPIRVSRSRGGSRRSSSLQQRATSNAQTIEDHSAATNLQAQIDLEVLKAQLLEQQIKTKKREIELAELEEEQAKKRLAR